MNLILRDSPAVSPRGDSACRSFGDPWIDAARAAAAFAVVAGHARRFLFQDFRDAVGLGALGKAFYLMTNLGHQAVVVFFVLSGFLVGGQVCAEAANGSWSWSRYLIMRLTRLWIVLLPALALTALWDRLGWASTHSPLYLGQLGDFYHSAPGLPNNGGDSPLTFVANALFLQTTNLPWLGAIPTFGTNGPLWSLANEFWYYVLFPLIWIAFTGHRLSLQLRFLMLTTAALTSVVLPPTMLSSGSIWLLGVAASLLRRGTRRRAHPLLLGVSAVVMAAGIVVSRASDPNLASDLLVGVGFAGWLASRPRRRVGGGLGAAICRRLANGSYTLYLTHFPLAAFLSCWLLNNRRMELTLAGFALFASVMAVLGAYAFVVARLFEAHTGALQTYLIGLIGGSRGPRAARVSSGDRW